jgi:hypothetical protein
MTIVLRFIFGVILAGSIAIFVGLPFPLEVVLVLSVGTMAAIWGDKFILGFMSLLRYLR